VNPALREATSGHEEYDALPAAVRMAYSVTEWLWLTDRQKAELVRGECEPEHYVD
jgi:hypothetical protein